MDTNCSPNAKKHKRTPKRTHTPSKTDKNGAGEPLMFTSDPDPVLHRPSLSLYSHDIEARPGCSGVPILIVSIHYCVVSLNVSHNASLQIVCNTPMIALKSCGSILGGGGGGRDQYRSMARGLGTTGIKNVPGRLNRQN